MNKNFYQNSGDTWTSKLARINAAKKELKEYWGIMTQYERTVAQKSVNELIEREYSNIYKGANSLFWSKVDQCLDAEKSYKAEVAKEINRWDGSKLANELSVAKMRISEIVNGQPRNPFTKEPGKAVKMKELYAEVKDSGDMYKQRALFEVLKEQNYDKLPEEDRMEVMHISKNAQADLQKLRKTDEMNTVSTKMDHAKEEFMTIRSQVIEVAKSMGENPFDVLDTGNYAKMVRRVKITDENLKVLDEKDPEITGVIWKTG